MKTSGVVSLAFILVACATEAPTTGSDLATPPDDMASARCEPGSAAASTDGCQARTCDDAGQWRPWSLGPDAQCSAGSVFTCEAQGCPRIGIRFCFDTCQWGPCLCL
jgi:hypothetical protein